MDRNPPAAAPGLPALEPGDYYFEGPNLVFIAAYHLKRGSCCNSGCRHCPYGATKPDRRESIPPSYTQITAMSEITTPNSTRDTVILGSGCSGLTAAIYAARANLKDRKSVV